MAFVFHLGNCELNCTLSYVFDNAGWYEQWTDETGEITG